MPDQKETESLPADEDFSAGTLPSPSVRKVAAPLLDEDFSAGTLPSPSTQSTAAAPPDEEVTAEQPGRYTLLGEHGRGGIGRVLVAFDRHADRQIALKELLVDEPGAAGGTTQGTSARFLREARITAGLEHPNIVPVYEVGRGAQGRLYYTMRLVRGRTLAAALAECQTLGQRLKWLGAFWDLCNAVSFAHSRGVIHRDLKPQNVMVGEFGETVVLDWGLAKVLGQREEPGPEAAARPLVPAGSDPGVSQSGVTVAGFALGTPEYMSPEQARGALDEIDGRADVWGLGAVLYEILTGVPPFRGSSAVQTLEQVLCGTLVPVLERCPAARPELAAIAERALRRPLAERYQGAKELTADVAAFMTGGRVGAYRYSSWELLKRFAEQNKPAIVAGAAVLAVILAALGMVTKALSDEREAHAAAQIARAQEHEERLRAQFHLSEAYLEKARRMADERRYLSSAVFAAAALLHNPAHPGGPHSSEGFVAAVPAAGEARVLAASQAYLSRVLGIAKLEATLRLEPPGSVEAPVPHGTVREVDLSPDGRLAAVAGLDRVALLDRASGRTRRLDPHGAAINDAVFSPDGRLVASAGDDGRVVIWDVASGARQRELAASNRLVTARFSPDGRTVAAAGRDGLVVWELEAGGLRWRASQAAARALAFSADGSRVATASELKTVEVWSAADGALQLSLPVPAGANAVAFSIDGERLAVGCADGSIELWPAGGGARLALLAGHADAVIELAFTRDGRRLVSVGYDRTVQVWDAVTGRRLMGTEPRREYVRGMGLSADGALLAVADEGLVVQLWSLGAAPTPTLEGHADAAYALAASPDGRQLASGSWDGELILWDLGQRRARLRLSKLGYPVGGLVFSPDGTLLFGALDDGVLRAWESQTGTQLWEQSENGHTIVELAVSPDGRHVACPTGGITAAIREGRTGELVRELRGHTERLRFARYSPDGRFLLTGGLDGTARLWDAASGDPVRVFDRHGDWVLGGDFSPDGHLIATGSRSREAIVWDAATGAERLRLVGHRGWVNTLRFSPDGKLLVTASDDRTARVWSVENGQLQLVIPTAKDAVTLAFLPDGTLALGDGNDVTLHPLGLADLQAEPRALLERTQVNSGLRLEGMELMPVE